MSVEADVLLGSDLAGYRLESVLGRGGMGVVYLATDLRLERKVALKLVAPELAADPRFRERFLRESRLAASLDHSHIVPVYAAGETDGQLWIAMRHVQGIDLKTLLEREGPLEPARGVELLSQVSEALDTAHAHGLVHRDVKPANVLVTEEDGAEHCYLADFGLARSPGDLQTADPAHLSGTIDYTAPEQIAREPLDPRADVYSLACVLYECLDGEPPFKRPRPVATVFAHFEEPPPSLHQRRPEVPEEIDHVIARALAKNPEERYESCRGLCDAARTALGIDAPRFTRRQIVVAGTGGTLAVAATAAIPAILLGSDDDAGTAAPPPVLPVTEDSVVRFDPGTGEAVAAIPTSGQPSGVAVSDTAVWLIATADRSLSQIEPATNEIVKTVEFSHSPSMLAVGEGAVWIATNPDAVAPVQRYDPSTTSVLPVEILFPLEISVGHGAVWVVGSPPTGTVTVALLRLDPATGAVVASFSGEQLGYGGSDAFSDSVLGLAIGQGGVWTASALGRVARIDPSSNTVDLSVDLNDVSGLDDIAVGEGAVWALSPSDDMVIRIDPSTGEDMARIGVGRTPTAVAAGAGAVWVTSARDGTLTRIDPNTLDLVPTPLGGAATSVAVGLGSVWVTVDVR